MFDIQLCVFFSADEPQPLPQLNGPLLTAGPLTPLTRPPTPPMDSPSPSVCPILTTPTPPLALASSSSPGCNSSSSSCGGGGSSSEQPGTGPGPVALGANSTSASSSPSNPETEEDKAKKLLYCSLCKVAVNSLSQLEAHNKGWSLGETIFLNMLLNSLLLRPPAGRSTVNPLEGAESSSSLLLHAFVFFCNEPKLPGFNMAAHPFQLSCSTSGEKVFDFCSVTSHHASQTSIWPIRPILENITYRQKS